MLRYWSVALLVSALAAASVTNAGGGKAEKDVKIDGKITKDDPKDTKRNTHCNIHVVQLKGGKRYTIDMIGMGFDAYLRLEDPKGKELAEDDDSGGNLNARIEFNCQRDGAYRVICTTYNEQGMGGYTLLVKAAGAAPKNVSTHEVLIGKAAPDFECDFAINGKSCKLSDLKGKVVLVEFLALTSEPCAATFPKLRAWHKAHAEAGLEVVCVTYYGSEVGQLLAFDKAAGKVIRVEKATMETDRDTLRAFAEHHKLECLLMALPKDVALKAFDAYAVNGVPQFVLLDRSGMVRAVALGESSRTTEAVDAELKKLLAAK